MQTETSHRRFRISLRVRFIFIIGLVCFFVFFLSAVVQLLDTKDNYVVEINSSSRAFAELATRPIGDAYKTYQSSGSQRVGVEVKKFTSLNPNVTNVAVLGVDGQILYTLEQGAPTINSTAASSFDPTYYKGSAGVYSTIIEPYFDTDGRHSYAVAYFISSANFQANLQKQEISVAISSLAGLLVTTGVTYFLISRFFLRQLKQVIVASKDIGAGNYSRQIITERQDEIGDLADTVNQMANSLKQAIYELKAVDEIKNEFIMITSHNLRTPIAIIQGYLSILRTPSAANTMTIVDSMQKALQQLTSFSEDMLTVSSIESNRTLITRQDITVSDLTQDMEVAYKATAGQKGLAFTWDITESNLLISVSPVHIRSVIRNLLDNAIKFTDKTGHVAFKLERNGTDIIISVTDTGIGITPDETKNLFTKFHRGTSTLAYNYEGLGIGLYAAKLIVQAHGGKIIVASTLGKGSTFTVLLPNAVVIK